MPFFRSISDLRNSPSIISDLCRDTQEPVYITRGKEIEMVIMTEQLYEYTQSQLLIYKKLFGAETEALEEPSGEDFYEFAMSLRKNLKEKDNEKI